MNIYNSHTHTSASPDCTAPIEDICAAAFEAGFKGLTISDHCCGSVTTREESFDVMEESVSSAMRMQNEYKGRMEIFLGTEIDEMF